MGVSSSVPEKACPGKGPVPEKAGKGPGTADFVTELERRIGRPIARPAPGRKAVAIPLGEQLNLPIG
jgi:hypothetical protein